MGDLEQMEFCTLGMFIIDDIEYVDGKSSLKDIVGGAGSYAALGARLVAGSARSRSVGWVVDAGSDFPLDIRRTLESWQTSCLFREDESRLTTRAWNGYEEGEHRGRDHRRYDILWNKIELTSLDFKYLTPKLRLDRDSLSGEQIMARTFHMVCSPQRCESLVSGISKRRRELWSSQGQHPLEMERPLIVWEPVPDQCIPEELANFREAIRVVDIVSPNAEEIAGFFRDREPKPSEEDMVLEVLGYGIGPDGHGGLVVRQGSSGCVLYTRHLRLHLRAYYLPGTDASKRVTDPTGGGNTFLGGLGAGLGGKIHPYGGLIDRMFARLEGSRPSSESFGSRNWLALLVYGTVAASYAIEQPGMPVLSDRSSMEEKWNGESFGERLATYMAREEQHIVEQLKT